MRLIPQQIVEYDGRRGVTCPDFMNCCDPDETPVVFDGESSFRGVLTASLTQIGPEQAVPDLKRCGAGRSADCCIFLTIGPRGAECARFSSLRYTLIFKKDTMTAKREPTTLYPGCLLDA